MERKTEQRTKKNYITNKLNDILLSCENFSECLVQSECDYSRVCKPLRVVLNSPLFRELKVNGERVNR